MNKLHKEDYPGQHALNARVQAFDAGRHALDAGVHALDAATPVVSTLRLQVLVIHGTSSMQRQASLHDYQLKGSSER